MSIVNIQRDFTLTVPGQTAIALPAGAINTDPLPVNADPVVYDDIASLNLVNGGVISLAADYVSGAACYLLAPLGDRTPYRVKASVAITDTDTKRFIVVGYAPASITGTSDLIADPVYIPFIGQFDDLLLVPAVEELDPNYGRALAVGIVVYAGAQLTNESVQGHLSVQRLGTKPPTMHNAVS